MAKIALLLALLLLAGCASTDQKVAAGNILLTAVTLKQKGCLPVGSNLDPYVACVNTDTDAKVQACLLAAVLSVGAPIPIPICAGGPPNPAPTVTPGPPVAVPPTGPKP